MTITQKWQLALLALAALMLGAVGPFVVPDVWVFFRDVAIPAVFDSVRSVVAAVKRPIL